MTQEEKKDFIEGCISLEIMEDVEVYAEEFSKAQLIEKNERIKKLEELLLKMSSLVETEIKQIS